jgi:hypothetical protein
MISFREHLALTEGVDDPGILKCVFMAGGPGSGKSTAAEELFGIDPKIKSSFSTYGLKVVNSDREFERLLKLHGVPTDLDTLKTTNPTQYNWAMELRGHAKDTTTKLRAQYEQGRLGLIIDGTGRDYDDIRDQREQSMAMGYDCYMVFVNTELDVALERNRRRSVAGGRTVGEDIVKEFWEACQRNLGKFQRLFGGTNFLVVDSRNDKDKNRHILELSGKAIRRWVAEPVKNHRGAQWIRLMGGRHGHH